MRHFALLLVCGGLVTFYGQDRGRTLTNRESFALLGGQLPITDPRSCCKVVSGCVGPNSDCGGHLTPEEECNSKTYFRFLSNPNNYDFKGCEYSMQYPAGQQCIDDDDEDQLIDCATVGVCSWEPDPMHPNGGSCDSSGIDRNKAPSSCDDGGCQHGQ